MAGEGESSDEEPLAARMPRKRRKSSSHVSGKRIALGTQGTSPAQCVRLTDADILDILAPRPGRQVKTRTRIPKGGQEAGVTVVDLWDGTPRSGDRSDEVRETACLRTSPT